MWRYGPLVCSACAGFKLLGLYTRLAEEKEAAPVLSNMHTTSTIFIYINICTVLAVGVKLYLFKNSIILTKSNEQGVLLYKCCLAS
jgi:RNA:NAD 2'-phosphotransferase (TPT1/KptA family)